MLEVTRVIESSEILLGAWYLDCFNTRIWSKQLKIVRRMLTTLGHRRIAHVWTMLSSHSSGPCCYTSKWVRNLEIEETKKEQQWRSRLPGKRVGHLEREHCRKEWDEDRQYQSIHCWRMDSSNWQWTARNTDTTPPSTIPPSPSPHLLTQIQTLESSTLSSTAEQERETQNPWIITLHRRRKSQKRHEHHEKRTPRRCQFLHCSPATKRERETQSGHSQLEVARNSRSKRHRFRRILMQSAHLDHGGSRNPSSMERDGDSRGGGAPFQERTETHRSGICGVGDGWRREEAVRVSNKLVITKIS